MIRGRTLAILSIFILAGAALFAVSSPVPLFAQEQETSDLRQEKEGLRAEIERINLEIARYEAELGDRRAEISTLQQQIAVINTRINKINAEISRTQKEINVTRINISETRSDIQEKNTVIADRKTVLAELLRRLDVIDNESMLEKLLRYDSLTAVFDEVRRLEELQLRIGRTLEETRIARGALEEKEATLKQNEGVLKEKNTQLAVQKSAEAGERENRNIILQETKQEEAKFQQLLSQAQQERARFMERVLQIEEQIAISRNFQTYFKAGEIPPRGTKLFIWPEDDPVLTQHHGFTAFARRGAYGGAGHNGIDMSAGLAAPIRAAAGGTIAAKGNRACVDYVNRSCNGYWGNWVAIEHGGGLVTLYSHMTKPSHRALGDQVEAGDIIGYEGATGNITGPHLHFTVYTEFFTYKDPATGETRFSYNYAKTLNPLDYL